MKLVTSKKLWVSSSFTERFGSKDIKPAKTVPAFKALPRYMNDSEIKKELGAQECTLEDVIAFLKNPPGGCNDGNWNLFYVAGCVVNVHWDSDRRKWSVLTWHLDDVYWLAGSRAFGCNSLSDPKPSDSLTLRDFETRVAKLEEIVAHHNLGV